MCFLEPDIINLDFNDYRNCKLLYPYALSIVLKRFCMNFLHNKNNYR